MKNIEKRYGFKVWRNSDKGYWRGVGTCYVTTTYGTHGAWSKLETILKECAGLRVFSESPAAAPVDVDGGIYPNFFIPAGNINYIELSSIDFVL